MDKNVSSRNPTPVLSSTRSSLDWIGKDAHCQGCRGDGEVFPFKLTEHLFAPFISPK